MLYESTRGGGVAVGSAEAIMRGLALDGGLYVPTGRAFLDPARLAGADYRAVAREVLALFLDDWPRDGLAAIVDAAYSPGSFGPPEVAPLRPLDGTASVLELWHGPTCAFKDMALQVLPRLLSSAMRASGGARELVVLVATSGDTGSAALDGFRDLAGTRVLVFYPEGGVSEVQRLQMLSQEGSNLGVVGVRGGDFDDAQAGVKAVFADAGLGRALAASGIELSSANSINWGRLVPQVAYYYWAYLRLLELGEIRPGERINVAVPTGNFGNILAAWYARSMGLPLARLVCASNANDVLARFIATGRYDARRSLLKTMSPSMDIVVSSNLERLLFELSGRDSGAVRGWMAALAREGSYDAGGAMREQVSAAFSGGSCGEEETLGAMRLLLERHGYLADPHTAVAANVYFKYREATGDGTKTVIVSTASPFKFNRSVARAVLGEAAAAAPDEFALMEELSRATGAAVPAPLARLKGKRVLHRGSCAPSGIGEAVAAFLGLRKGGGA